MPDPITWGQLAKAIGDNTLISDEIATLILNHNLDPSAHGQSNEAVYNHRISELLDHVSYSVYNIKMNPASRVYKAFVAPGLEGDFTTIQQAIDWAHLYGGGIVYVKPNTYTLTSDIVLYENIHILGEDQETVIFDFNNGAYQFKLVGTSGTHKKNVVIENIQIKNSHKGYYGALYFEYADDVEVKSCKFQGNKSGGTDDGAAITVKNVKRVRIRDNYFYDNEASVTIDSGTKIEISNNEFEADDFQSIVAYSGDHIFVFNNRVYNAANAAIWLEAVDKVQIVGNFIDTYTSYGITTGENNPSSYLVIANNYIEDGGVSSAAIYLGMGSTYCSVVGNVLKNNNGFGIYLPDGDKNTITGNVVTGGDVGVQLDASSDKNIVVANNLVGNSTGLVNNGTNGQTANNITA